METIFFEFFCEECGEKLEYTIWSGRSFIKVKPCQKCLEAARDKGYEDGHYDGLQEEREEES